MDVYGRESLNLNIMNIRKALARWMDAELTNIAKKGRRINYALNKTILGRRGIDRSTNIRVYNTVTIQENTDGNENLVIQRKHGSENSSMHIKYGEK